MKRLFLVLHTHWDREWHKTFQENRVRLIGFMDDLMTALEDDPAFACFVLDGQTSLLLDYLDVCPQEEPRIARLVQSGRMVIGPWYVQPDVNIPSAESLLRNLLVSGNIAKRFGSSMPVGYLPDSFGMSADLPTLLRAFGIESAVFYRGLSADDLPQDVFCWQGQDGSQVVTAWLPDGYGNAMFLPPQLEQAAEQIKEIIDKRQLRSVADCYLLMSGSDQCYPKKHLPGLCAQLQQHLAAQGVPVELSVCTPQAYLQAVGEERDTLHRYSGELRRGRHSRTHLGIAGTRLDIKQRNCELDARYKYLLEPLCTVASLQGIAYPSALIDRGWRYIVENHAHDSICCCCTDVVHREMLGRFAAAEQIADTLCSRTFEALHHRIRYQADLGRPLLLFSSYPGTRRELVTATVYVKERDFFLSDSRGTPLPYVVNSTKQFNLKDVKVSLSPIPDDYYFELCISFYMQMQGVGYTTCYLNEGSKPEKIARPSLVADRTLQNDLLRCTVEQDGSLTLLDKQSGRLYERQHILVDGGNAGDEYDYSPPRIDQAILSTGCLQSVTVVEDTPLRATLELNYLLEIPQCIDADGRSAATVPLSVATRLSLAAEAQYLDIETTVNNEASGHRLQVVFDLGERVESHIADVQLGELVRENSSTLTATSEQDGWSERYYPIYSQQKYMALLSQDGSGLMVMNKGLPQYQILQGETTQVALTLLSSVSRMGEEKLLYRPGRRSGSVCDTPDAKMLGSLTVQYSLGVVTADTVRPAMGEQYHNPVASFAQPEYDNDGVLPDEFTALTQMGRLSLMAFKQQEQGDGVIVRFVNPGTAPLPQQEVNTPNYLFESCATVSAAELPVTDASVTIDLQSNPDRSDPYHFVGRVALQHPQPHSVTTLLYQQ